MSAAPIDKTHHIGILVYPGAQLAAVHGLTDLFQTANQLSAERGGWPDRLEVSHLHPDSGLLPPAAPLSALILPPSLGGAIVGEAVAPLCAWTRDRHREGTLLCSVCAGAFLLAETGLLTGRPATTHWALADRFGQRFPSVKLDINKLIVDDGDIITAGGVMAWVDLGLLLIDRFLSPALMLATARMFLVDPGGREQRFYRSFAPQLTHGDAAILKVQHWLFAECSEAITLPMMAATVGLGQRTFLRRFHKATGLTPAQYLQHLRIGKSRDLLEREAIAIDEIAWQVGYQTPSAFRKIFQRIIGLSPSDYRRRFAITRRG